MRKFNNNMEMNFFFLFHERDARNVLIFMFIMEKYLFRSIVTNIVTNVDDYF